MYPPLPDASSTNYPEGGLHCERVSIGVAARLNSKAFIGTVIWTTKKSVQAPFVWGHCPHMDFHAAGARRATAPFQTRPTYQVQGLVIGSKLRLALGSVWAGFYNSFKYSADFC